MGAYLLKKRLFAVLFLVTVFGFSIVNCVKSYESIRESLAGQETISVSELDTAITDNLYGKMNFIETYAYVQKLLDKRECNNFSYIKDEAGYLHYASFFREEDTQLFEYAMRVKRLQDYAEQQGTHVIFVTAPGKYDPEYTVFRTGLKVNDHGYEVDTLLFYLNRLGVETLDLRDYLPNAELTYEETFFKTDHHWTIPAAFYGMKALVEKVEETFGENLDPDGYYTNIENYESITYPKEMLGSMGRRTGIHFSGVEDFTALWPKFDGDFYRESLRENGELQIIEGSFIDTLMEKDNFLEKDDLYTDSPYGLYLSTIRVFEKLVNREKPDGTHMLMIRDSYFSPVMAFMLPMCGEIDAIWTLEESDEVDIETYVKENQFDYIVIEVYPYSIDETSFNFFKESR